MKTKKWKDITEDIEEIKETISEVRNSPKPESEKNKRAKNGSKIDPSPKGSRSLPYGFRNFK